MFLGVQWDCGSWDNLPTLCDFVISKIGNRPLVWNFPSPPSESLRRTKQWLQKTVTPRVELDCVAPMGFAGACNPVLALDELEKEISWSLANPWGTGVSQVLGIRPEVLIPRVADVARVDAQIAYRRHGFKTIGIFWERGISWFVGDGMEWFTCMRLLPSNLRDLRRPLESNTLIMLDLSGSVALENLARALELVTPLMAPEGTPSPLVTKHSPSGNLHDLSGILLDWSPFPAPALRTAVAAGRTVTRKRRKRNDEYRELLLRLSLAAPASDADRAAEAPISALRKGSQIVAQMLGEVLLAGGGFDVRLAGGRFTGICRNGRDVLPLRPAQSYLRVAGRPWHFRTRNSFSFEGEQGTGLREVLGIDSQESASLSIEYNFCEGSSVLEIIVDVQWPAFSPGAIIDEHAPFVITLRELGRAEEALIQTETPEGSLVSMHAAGARWTVMPGALHRIALKGGGTLLFRPGPGPEGSKAWNLASFRVVREGRRYFLEANPFGGWLPLPGALLSERRESFSLLIGIEA